MDSDLPNTKGAAAPVDTQSDKTESDTTGLSNGIIITDEAKTHLDWSGGIVSVRQDDTFYAANAAPYVSRRSPWEVGLDPLEHPVYVDAEKRSEELAAKRTLEKMFPGLTEDIGELFG